MGRPTERTKELTRDEMTAIRAVFGNARNAWAWLSGKHGKAAYDDVKAMLAGKPAKQAARDALRDAWESWRMDHAISDEDITKRIEEDAA